MQYIIFEAMKQFYGVLAVWNRVLRSFIFNPLINSFMFVVSHKKNVFYGTGIWLFGRKKTYSHTNWNLLNENSQSAGLGLFTSIIVKLRTIFLAKFDFYWIRRCTLIFKTQNWKNYNASFESNAVCGNWMFDILLFANWIVAVKFNWQNFYTSTGNLIVSLDILVFSASTNDLNSIGISQQNGRRIAMLN